jgi:hypothetical protein
MLRHGTEGMGAGQMKAIQLKGYVVIRCRACGQHLIPVPRWNFNGSFDSPTFTPSINETCNDPGHPSYQPQAQTSRCHFVVTNGQITYCGDCLHSLAGQTMPLEDFSEADVVRYQGEGYQ